ncbi:MBL fold metallo-hydrolase [Paractinoplanes durhamensis]|uniref:Hydrolase n=1 Tax=Paractinoplanes durhamensis TaxID=113563 RepID=A0ABQ3Z0J0_9ACTN|nr:MBL fold metallo-hydrolase [Actinoplanes durhamensis]GIE03343.1 hydrolase [Actinoplanes durhamensis]
MAYTGDVRRGSAPATRTLDHLTVTKVSVGPTDNNAYLLRCGDDRVLIDAANDAPALLELIGEAGIRAVITTHRHYDHWQALAAVVEATGARSLAHAADAAEIPVVTDTLADGDKIPVGEGELEVIHLVGHTPGSIALLYRDPNGHAHLWTGDSLFPGGVGNTGQDAARFGSLIDDVEHKLFDRLPDDTWFYPGHGKDSTLGTERPHLAEWRERGW